MAVTQARIETRLTVDLSAVETVGALAISPELKATLVYAIGIAAGQIDRAYVKELDFSASEVKNLDLVGALLDQVGGSGVFAKVRGIYMVAPSTNPGNIEFGGHATAAFLGPFKDATDKMKIEPGEVAVFSSKTLGWPVTATTADMWRLENMVASASKLGIGILGTSA